MARKRSQAGKDAGSPLTPTQTAPDSWTDAAAPASESGAEPGAASSNTAPHNSNTAPPEGFRLLRLAVDSLYLSYSGELLPSSLDALSRLKVMAQSDLPQQQAKAQYPVGGHIFEVKDKGAGLFPFVLEDNAYRIQFSRQSKTLPMAYVKVSAHYLAHKGPQAVQDELRELLAEFGTLGANTVSRIDLAADFTSSVVMDSWHRSAWVTRATEIHSYAKDQRFTGWTIGLGGHVACRLYDKVAEVVHSGKDWNYNLWLAEGWKPGQDVWRLEFQFKREFLKGRQLGNLDSVLDHLNGLWSYATTEWLRLTAPNKADATRTRWPTHGLWVALAACDWESTHSVLLDKYSNARNPTELRLIAVVLGSLASFMAMHNITDRNEGVDRLLNKLYEHYSRIAAYDGLSFDEYLLRRVAVKAREFNTAINAHSLVDNLKKDYEDEQAEAYRRASRGW